MARAAVFESVNGPMVVRELANRDPGPEDVLVRNLCSGVCHTDQSVWNGSMPIPPPAVLGHEGAGVVEAVGERVRDVAVGDMVVTSCAPACGKCWFCLAGEPQSCARMSELTASAVFVDADGTELRGMAGLGTFSEMMTVNQASVFPVRTDLPPEQLALVSCGVTTGFGAVLNTARVQPGASVAVFGCGGVGQSVIQAAVISGATTIVAVDPVPTKRESALAIGATDAVDPGSGDPAQQIRDLTSGRGVDYSFEALGKSETMLGAWKSTRVGGKTVVIGMSKFDDVLTLPAPEVLLSRRSLVGSIFGGGDASRIFQTVVGLAEQGRIDLGGMVSRIITIHDVVDAFGEMDKGSVVRSVIRYS
ncbi:MAG: Zn-dependent alcohol dehydrogenase [Acidimicrobiia bacterium]